MPRVAINKKKYMLKDLSEWITGRMKTLGLTQSDVGELLGITQQAFCQKVAQCNFKYSELLPLLKRLQATDEEILRLMKL